MHADVPACPKMSSAGRLHTVQPGIQSVLQQLQTHCLSDLDLGQTVTVLGTQKPVQPDCPLAADEASEADVVASGKLLIPS